MTFQLHPQLRRDTHRLGTFRPDQSEAVEFVHALLHRNAVLHWFILVPQCGDEHTHQDWLDLPETDVRSLTTMAQATTHYLKTSLHYPRVNFGAIGNVVPQIHLHIVGRRPDDICWPAPVWGNLGESVTYQSEALEQIAREVADSFTSARFETTDLAL